MNNRRSYTKISLLIGISLFLASNLAIAQNSPFESSFDFDTTDSRYYKQVKQKYSTHFIEADYTTLLESLLGEFIAEDVIWNDASKTERIRFIKGLNHFIDSLTAFSDLEVHRLEGGFFDKADPGGFTQPYLRYFPDKEGLEIVVSSANLTAPQAEDLRYRMNTLNRIADLVTKDDRIRVEKKLVRLNEAWDNFHFNAKSQYPWEFLVNSVLLKRQTPLLTPPKTQLILLHPNISLELETSDLKKLKATEIFNIEVAGVAWGLNNHKDYLAVSGLFTLNNDLGNGYGGMLSYNSTQLGIVFHNSTGGTPNIVLSIDLFKFFQHSKEQWNSIRAN